MRNFFSGQTRGERRPGGKGPFMKGLMEDSVGFVEWSNAYEHFISIRKRLENQVFHAA
jgi:hypothetical protein